MRMMSLILVSLVLVGLSACSRSAPVLKSPCVGISGSPCGDRQPINDWWLRGETVEAEHV